MKPEDSFRLFDEMTAFIGFIIVVCLSVLVLHFA